MTPTPPAWVKTSLVTAGSIAVALFLRLHLDPILLEVAPFLVFIFAVTVSAWYGGFTPGVVATLASVMLGNYFFTDPVDSLRVADAAEATQAIVFSLEGVLISVLSGARLTAVRRAEGRARALRSLASELTLTEERQRREMAQGLHDHLQQLLLAARMRVSTLRRGAPATADAEPLDALDDLLKQSLDYTRTLTADLSPPVLYEAGLIPALQWLAEQFQRRHQLSVEVRAPESELPPLPETLRVLLFQAARELLFNVVKHADVQRAEIRVECDGRSLCLDVADQGAGFDPAAVARRAGTGGFGLFSIRERISSLGGRVEFDSAPGRGTRTRLVAPLGGPSARA